MSWVLVAKSPERASAYRSRHPQLRLMFCTCAFAGIMEKGMITTRVQLRTGPTFGSCIRVFSLRPLNLNDILRQKDSNMGNITPMQILGGKSVYYMKLLSSYYYEVYFYPCLAFRYAQLKSQVNTLIPPMLWCQIKRPNTSRRIDKFPQSQHRTRKALESSQLHPQAY